MENTEQRDGPGVHPWPPHPQDLVAIEVVFPHGVRENGRVYRCGETLTLARGHAQAQNSPGRPVYRLLRTVRYVNGPPEQAEQGEEPGPLSIS